LDEGVAMSDGVTRQDLGKKLFSSRTAD